MKIDTSASSASYSINSSTTGSNGWYKALSIKTTLSANGSSDAHSGIASYQYSRNNSTWYTSTSNSYTFTGLSAGTYTLYVKVTDKSGRVSGTISTSITISISIKTLMQNWNYNGVNFPSRSPTGNYDQWSDVVEINNKRYIQFNNVNLTNVFKVEIQYSTYGMRAIYIQNESGNNLFNPLTSYTSNTAWNIETKQLNKVSGVTGNKNIRFKTNVSKTCTWEAMLYHIKLYQYS